MLIRKPADIRYSEITPKQIYINRRKFLAGVPAAFLAARELLSPSARALAASPIPNLVKSPLSTTARRVNTKQDVTHYNNYYEFGTDKEQPADAAPRTSRPRPGPSPSKAKCAKPRKFSTRRDHEARAARRAHLPPSLRGSLVDRGAVDRLSR